MIARFSGWARLGKLTLALLLLSGLLFVVLVTHAIVTGVAVPYQDATPEQEAYERFHLGIGTGLMLGFAMSAFLTLVVGMSWLLRRLWSAWQGSA